MKGRDYLPIFGLVLRKIAAIGLGLAVAIAAVCWFGGWWTLHGYGGGLVWGGIVAIVAGAFSVAGALTVVGDEGYQAMRTIQPDNVRTYHRGDRDFVDERVVSFVQWLVAGIVLIALGELLRAVSR